MNITPTVKQLLIINVLFFLGAQLVPLSEKYFALYYFENPNFRYWQPLTHMFMHGNLMHIVFNMFALISFGSLLENIWGTKKFLFFYFSCGLGAALIHSGVNYYFFHEGVGILQNNGFNSSDVIATLSKGKYDSVWEQLLSTTQFQNMITTFSTPAVGASGAIYGLLIAFAFLFPNAELALMFIPIPIKAKYFVTFLVGIDLFSGVTGYSIFSTGVAHFAHVGGALVGFIIMWYWKNDNFKSNSIN